MNKAHPLAALADDVVEVAEEYADGRREPAEPRDAATVILLRDGGDGSEIYYLRRQTSMAFAAQMCVYLGGGVDRRDYDTSLAWSGPSAATWAEQLDCDEDLAQALVCAAVRETFEESGVLLAGPSPDAVVADTTGEDWEADRVALETRTLSMTDFLARRELVLRTDLLGAWAAWLTPVFEPRRYRTWFFVALLPQGQRTRDVSSESSEVVWLPATAAVSSAEAGEMLMMPPTFLTSLEVASYAGPNEVIAAAQGRVVAMHTPTVEPLRDHDRVHGHTLSIPEHLRAVLAAYRDGHG